MFSGKYHVMRRGFLKAMRKPTHAKIIGLQASATSPNYQLTRCCRNALKMASHVNPAKD